jgi:group I intron endonuclease
MKGRRMKGIVIYDNDTFVTISNGWGDGRVFKKDWFYSNYVEPFGFIYLITNTVNKKVYIGKTVKMPFLRFEQHIDNAFNPRLKKTYLYNAICKYGKDAFSMEVIERCYSKDELEKREVFYILKYKSYLPDIGYNMTVSSDGGVITAVKLSRQGEKNANYQMGFYRHWIEKYGQLKADEMLLEFKETQKELGRIAYETQNKKDKLTFKGHTHTDEGNEKNRQSKLGKKNPMYGKTPYDVWVIKFGIEEANKKFEIYERNRQEGQRRAAKEKKEQRKGGGALL